MSKTDIEKLKMWKDIQVRLFVLEVNPKLVDIVVHVQEEWDRSVGIKIAVETINHLREIEGIAGIHIMTLQREELIPKICSAVGLYPRP